MLSPVGYYRLGASAPRTRTRGRYPQRPRSRKWLRFPLRYDLACETGTFAITGNNATLTVSRALTANVGTITVTGNDATLIASRVLTANNAAYTITGYDATLLFTGGQTTQGFLTLAESVTSIALDEIATTAITLTETATTLILTEELA